MNEVAAQYDRDLLAATGWRQGSLLPGDAGLRPSFWVSPNEQGWSKAQKDAANRARQGELSEPYLFERPSKAGDRLALITQDCDLLKPPNEFPIVEFALVFETSSAAVIGEADSLTSARYLRLGESSAESPVPILDYRFKAQADKGVLVEYNPDNALLSQMSEPRRGVLREWLGRRLGREAVSDEDTHSVVEPIRDAWKQLLSEEPELAERWAAMAAELRFRHEGSRLRLYLIAHDDVDPGDPDVLEMVDWVVAHLRWAGSLVDVTVTSEWTMTIGEHRATQEIDLAWASYDE